MIGKFFVAPLTALAIFCTSTTFAATNPFKDVPANHWAYDAVVSLAANGIAVPDSSGKFNGNKNATRYDLAFLLGNLLDNNYKVDFQNPSPFSDVPENHRAHKAIAELTACEIMDGYDDETFRGDLQITRYELALTLNNFLQATSKISDSAIDQPFSDIPKNHWAYPAVCNMVAAKLMEGYGDKTFRGDRNITLYEVALIIAQMNTRYFS